MAIAKPHPRCGRGVTWSPLVTIFRDHNWAQICENIKRGCNFDEIVTEYFKDEREQISGLRRIHLHSLGGLGRQRIFKSFGTRINFVNKALQHVE